MTIKHLIPTCFIILSCIVPGTLFGENTDDSSVEESSFVSYGVYEKDEEEFVPTRISYIKLLTFPFMTVGTPIAFPAYYIFTKEPKLSQSLSNYWEHIYYKVSYDVDSIADQEVVFPQRYPLSEQEKDALYRSKRIKKHLKKGEKYYLKKDYVKALAEYNLVLDLEPENERAVAMIEKIAEIQESHKEETLIKAEAKKRVRIKKEIQKLLREGEHYYEDKKYEKALREYNTVIELDAKNKHAQTMIDKIVKIQQAHKAEEVRKQKEKGRIHTQKDVEKYLTNGEKYYKKESFDKALKAYTHVLEYDPQNGKAQTMVENIMKRQKSQKEKAEQRRKKEEVKKLLKSGDKYYKKKKYHDALKDFNAVLILDAKNEHALKMKETIAEIERLQEIERTIEEEKQKLDSVSADKKDSLPTIHATTIETEEIQERRSEEIPDNLPIESLLQGGREQFEEKKYERARYSYKQVLRYFPENKEAEQMVQKISQILEEQELDAEPVEKETVTETATEDAVENLIRNGDFETWSQGTTAAPDGWVERKEGVRYARVAEKQYGTYGLSMIGSSRVGYLTFQKIQDYTSYAKKTLTASCWVKTSGPKVNLRLDDGSVTNSNYHSGSGGWELLSVTKNISNLPSRLRLAIAQPPNAQKDEVICDGAIVVVGDSVVEFIPNRFDVSAQEGAVHIPFL